MSHGGDDTAACCILGVCCRRGGRAQAQALDQMMAEQGATAASILSVYQLVPLALIEERKDFARLLDSELRGYLERRGVEIKPQSGDTGT